jgi:thiamine monophosphate kinase
VIELERVPLADGATLSDLAFGEDYELLAAVPAAQGHAVVGRVEPGAGTDLLLHGEPYMLQGWEHFS